jgi:phage terminase large subunit GpA-like protein
MARARAAAAKSKPPARGAVVHDTTSRQAAAHRRREAYPDWFLTSLRALRPPDDLTVSEAAARYRYVDRNRSYDPDLTPYLNAIQDAWLDPEVEEIWFRKPTQIGGTRLLFNILAYIILQDPDDTLLVYPTDKLARAISVNRIQPMLLATPELAEQFLPAESTDLELHFRSGMVIYFGGANSPASLAAHPVPYVLLDEVAKFPYQSADDANPIKLAMERQKNFPHRRKLIGLSSPKYDADNICRQAKDANEVLEFHISCPHCGSELNFRFRSEDGKRRYLRWREGATPEQAEETAYYECHDCLERITDAMKPELVKGGRWLPVRSQGTRRRKLFFQTSSLLSLLVSFGRFAREYLASVDDPDDLMNFVNGWLGEAYRNTKTMTDTNLVLAHKTAYDPGELPREALLLTAGIDWQQGGYMYWVIRAWGVAMTSWNIGYGLALSPGDLEAVMNRPYVDATGRALQVELCCVDSGDGNTVDEVYDFCALNREWAVPSKGSSRAMTSRYSLSKVDRAESNANGMRLIIVDTGKFKDMIASRLNRPNGRGSWMVHAETDEEYADQITSEHKVPGKHGGEVWEPKFSHVANHYLDAEVYAAVAAEIQQVRYLSEQLELAVDAPPPPAPVAAGSGWVRPREGWVGG